MVPLPRMTPTTSDEDGDGELTQSEFVAACADGNIRGTSTTGPGAGTR